ncbi:MULTISPECIES: flagellar biosynthetic protein FliO [unclassified Pseudodesulfovibrio]|uniref:flagellar biosynthetic protein FliO n=1 Tax=unclassified Pseudodesulfovibrio TaxID=2661612 RepID=UPI000FEB9ED8|nr:MULTISPECIES: flagellar biosynthetic protein FliO [unclassified Pseudodesulfovibrio]MCJ2166059.1 flagellar biosynthetic protein FliO [Pseudodesulfovibrio sp. S3-i]RWU02504.1 flagellar biosynthetic protein FliO [Pseudodesulfovibrio sp. S3]
MQLPAVDSGTTILTTTGYLFLLLGVIFLAYYLLKRFGVPGALTSGRSGPRLLSRLMLGNRQSVAVIRYRDKDLLLGVTEDNITLLSESQADADEEPPAPVRSFASLLKRSARDDT